MPRLHKYRNRDACYVLTRIRGAVVTFQLTPDGERKLAGASIALGTPSTAPSCSAYTAQATPSPTPAAFKARGRIYTFDSAEKAL